MPPSFVMFDLWFHDAHPVYFPIDVVPSKPSRFRGCPKPTVAAQSKDHLPNRVDLGLDQASGHLSSVPFEPALVSASPGLSQGSYAGGSADRRLLDVRIKKLCQLAVISSRQKQQNGNDTSVYAVACLAAR
jgi:hypothetical protein